MDWSQVWPWVLLVTGIIARIVVPFLVERQKDPLLGWDRKYILPQILGFVVIALMLPVIIPNLDSISDLNLQAAFLSGWAGGDIGNVGRKFLTST